MPEIMISIGGRDYEVACQEGEEHYLKAAASLLNAEAQVLINQIGRMPESRVLLMAGLMLADKAAAHDDKVREVERRAGKLQAELEALRAAPAAAQSVEAPVIPAEVSDMLSDLAAQAEALAETLEAKAVLN